MSIALLFLIALVAAALVLVLVLVRRDGYGSRPGPRSHHDPFDPFR